MIWTDVIASVSQNRASRLLPTYRRILTHFPADTPETAESMILMDKVMGCDSTTVSPSPVLSNCLRKLM